jgi:hypothetical protein
MNETDSVTVITHVEFCSTQPLDSIHFDEASGCYVCAAAVIRNGDSLDAGSAALGVVDLGKGTLSCVNCGCISSILPEPDGPFSECA